MKTVDSITFGGYKTEYKIIYIYTTRKSWFISGNKIFNIFGCFIGNLSMVFTNDIFKIKNRKIKPSCDSYLNTIYSMHYLIFTVFYDSYYTRCIPRNVYYALHPMHCILFIICIVFNALYFIYCILWIIFYALYHKYCILCIVSYALHSIDLNPFIALFALHSRYSIIY